MNRAPTISRFQLTALLVLISTIPPAFVVSMVAFNRPPPEPRLDVQVEFDVTVIHPRKSPDSPRILPCVKVRNPTEGTWRNIAVSLNKDFFFYYPEPLGPGEEIVAPLEFFVTKGGNVLFQPGSSSVRRVTVFAQIPDKSRAVAELYFDEDGNPEEPPKSSNAKAKVQESDG